MFGDIGNGKIPWYHALRRWIQAIFLIPWRLFFAILLALWMRFACALSSIKLLWPITLGPAARGVGRAMLFVFGFVWIRHKDWRRLPGAHGAAAMEGRQLKPRSDTAVVICNHVSWADILVVQVFYAAAFVTRAETAKTPIIGGICNALPCIYVRRAKKRAAAPASDEANGAHGGAQTGADPVQVELALQGDASSTTAAAMEGAAAAAAGAVAEAAANGGAAEGGEATTTEKVIEHIRRKHGNKHLRLRPLCSFVEVCSLPSSLPGPSAPACKCATACP